MQNTSFIPNTTLQHAWDSTSLRAIKECPRKYFYSIVQGWQPRETSVHLIFGLHYHSALERYDHAKTAGASHADAQRQALHHAMVVTWDKTKGRPWLSDDPNKNRWTLIRSIVWYLDQFENDPLQTVILSNGKPAVELSFRWQTSYTNSYTDAPFFYCGHIDRLATLDGSPYVLDRKTSKSAIDGNFFSKFSPDTQLTGYEVSANVVYSVPVLGVIVDAVQTGANFSRFARQTIPRHESQRQEWYEGLQFWLSLAEHFAKTGNYPMNEQSCGNYGGCSFREICSKPASSREMWLQAGFKKRIWDPLQVRGDI